MIRPHQAPKLASLAAALRNALVLATAVLIAPAFAATQPAADKERPAKSAAAAKKEPAARDGKAPKAAGKDAKSDGKDAKAAGKGTKSADAKKGGKKKQAEEQKPGPLADFGKVQAPDDVVHLANWVSHTRNSKKKSFVLIDKKMARLYVFDANGKLKGHTPVLLGKAIGDHTAPGVGSKSLAELKEEEKTTPAGRFLALPGKNTHGEDIIWIDYNAAVSMHRLRKVAEEERRAERMATPDASDNRISNGCVNVPPRFYNATLKPTVLRGGAFVYVLPETKTAQQLFGSFDVPAGGKRA